MINSRLLVCGSRDWTDRGLMIEAIVAAPDPTIIIHGAQRGADRLAGEIAEWLHIPVSEYPADWGRYGRGAGPIRNQAMIDKAYPNLVYAFKDGFDSSLKRGGTEDMIRRTIAAGISYKVFSHGV